MKLIYRILPFVFCVLIFNQNTEAQTSKQNGIYLECQPRYLPFTIKYERSILQTEKLRVNAQVGYSHQLLGSSKEFGISGGINLLTGIEKSHFEFGFNVWMIRAYNLTSPYFEDVGQLMLGYRYQDFEKNGLIFRIGFAPSYIDNFELDLGDSRIEMSPYIGFGFNF